MKGAPAKEHLARRLDELGLGLDDLSVMAEVSVDVLKHDELEDELSFNELERVSDIIGIDLATYDPEEDEAPQANPHAALLLKASREFIDPESYVVVRRVAKAAHELTLITTTSTFDGWRAKFEQDAQYSEPVWKDGRRLAESLREQLGLGTEPIESMYALYDRLGVHLFEVVMDEHVAGFCMADAHHGVAVGVNVRGAGEWALPRRFTLAHELCHLVFDRYKMDDGSVHLFDPASRPSRGKRDVEVRADAFSIHFLVPESRLRIEWEATHEQPTPRRIAHIIDTFGVSFTALSHHLRNSGLLTPDELSTMDGRVPSDAGSRFDDLERHPGDDRVYSALPPLLRGPVVTHALAALSDGTISSSKAMELLGVDGDTLAELVVGSRAPS